MPNLSSVLCTMNNRTAEETLRQLGRDWTVHWGFWETSQGEEIFFLKPNGLDWSVHLPGAWRQPEETFC